jgi:hypothetical protein
MVAYVVALIAADVLRGEAQALGQMLWAAAHGLVMLRLSGVIASDTELRQLHEQTMSALVRGAQSAGTGTGTGTRSTAGRPTRGPKPISPVPARKAGRKAP